jgi:hypothetical protein
VSLADMLEALARVVPGVSGYLDRERRRDTDKAVRERVAAGLEGIVRELENDKRALVDARDLAALPALDRLAAKLQRLADTVRYAARGYRGLFDVERVSEGTLERLCKFDLDLCREVDALRAGARGVREARADRARLAAAIDAMDAALDRFDRMFAMREGLVGEAGESR